ncbi:MAG: zinc-dependent alcohol dehydrogenase family protein [Saprospiraceae bacterium]
MQAILYDNFREPLRIQSVPDPIPSPQGVVLRVEATGLCRSDWHGWMGNDPDITPPHVPGHELAGVIVEKGANVSRWQIDDRVTLPFVGGCGHCPQCLSGNHQVCDEQFQPGFTHWGAFAQFVAIEYADINLVRLPEEMNFVTAASLGCRFSTAFRSIVAQGRVKGGDWVAIHGCGGVGLSAIMIAHALGANVIAVDINPRQLELAKSLGAIATLNPLVIDQPVAAIKDISHGGVQVSVDALGSQETCFNSIANLRKRGKHIQVGLMVGDHKHPKIPMDKVVANELEILGSHGMQAYEYPRMLDMINKGLLKPEKLIGRTICLEEAIIALPKMDTYHGVGVTVVDRFE